MFFLSVVNKWRLSLLPVVCLENWKSISRKKMFGAESKILRVKNMKKKNLWIYYTSICFYRFYIIIYGWHKIKKYAQKWDLKRVLASRKILKKSYFISNHNSNMRFVWSKREFEPPNIFFLISKTIFLLWWYNLK